MAHMDISLWLGADRGSPKLLHGVLEARNE